MNEKDILQKGYCEFFGLFSVIRFILSLHFVSLSLRLESPLVFVSFLFSFKLSMRTPSVVLY